MQKLDKNNNHGCFKTSKTLTGIETAIFRQIGITPDASKHLKPLQGLKQPIAINAYDLLRFKTSKTLTGIETTRQCQPHS